jgi:hypothetical protein
MTVNDPVNDFRSAGRRRWRLVSCEEVSGRCLWNVKIRSGIKGVVDEVWVCVGDLVLAGVAGQAEALQFVEE